MRRRTLVNRQASTPWIVVICLRSLSMCLSLSSSDVAMNCHPYIFVGVVGQGCTVFASETKHSQLYAVAWQRTTEKQVKLVESCLLLRLFSGTQYRSNFLASWIHRLVCVHPDQLEQFLACICTMLQRDNFVETRSNAIILHSTLPAVCIEKVVNMMSREELYSKMYQAPELQQRIVLKLNLHHERQDSTNFEARASVDHLGREYGPTRGGREYGDTRCGNIDVRIQGIAAFNCPTTRHPQGRQSKSWFIYLERIQVAKRWKPTWKRIKSSTHSARSRRTWSAAWETLEYFEMCPWLFNILDDRHCTLYLRDVLATFWQKSQIKQR